MIRVNNLEFSYDNDKKVIKDISFNVNKGEIFGFLGPNGSGKSTTQKLLTGILKKYDGSINLLGKELKNWDEKLYECISVLFEYPYLYNNLSARDNLKYFASFYPINKRLDIETLLSLLELKPDYIDKPVERYSKGMKQRTNMARALISSPDILFLDEPTSGLDPSGAVLFRDIIKREQEKGTTVFLTTHNMHDAELLCDRIAFIVDGKIKAIDSPMNFKRLYSEDQVLITYKHEGKKEELSLTKSEFIDKFNVEVDEIISIHSKEPNLEDIFLRLTGKELRQNV